VAAVRIEVELSQVRTVTVRSLSVEVGPVTFFGSHDDMEWIRLEIAEAFGLIVPEEQDETENATVTAVAS
jgi:hypothetical protein